VEELKQLWDVGLAVRDAITFNGETDFNMHAIFMWTMHELLVYAIVAGCATKRY